jgi:hypothetical protein
MTREHGAAFLRVIGPGMKEGIQCKGWALSQNSSAIAPFNTLCAPEAMVMLYWMQ